MEHNIGPEAGENLLDSGPVAQVAQDQVGGRQEGAALDGQLHAVESGLVTVKHEQPFRGEPVDLLAQL